MLYEDDRRLPPVKRGSGYYATDAIGDHAVKCLRDHAENHSQQPFFHFLAFTAPHFPLHALPADIAKYRKRYRRSWEWFVPSGTRGRIGDHHGKTLAGRADLGPRITFRMPCRSRGRGKSIVRFRGRI
ncbi:MAG: hypothetical protein CM1200mP2_19600 [Planctomycetaceae bacterium]|nr:MAG: hypothetical protein CM1200mP2_19600 [Planctomycetaceae bacterium]